MIFTWSTARQGSLNKIRTLLQFTIAEKAASSGKSAMALIFILRPAIFMLDSSATENNHCSFPVSHYHGITITISVPEAVEGLGDLLSLFSIDLEQIEQQFALKTRPFIMHGNSVPDHVISELYQVPDNIRLEYLRVKNFRVISYAQDGRPYSFRRGASLLL